MKSEKEIRKWRKSLIAKYKNLIAHSERDPWGLNTNTGIVIGKTVLKMQIANSIVVLDKVLEEKTI